MCFVQILHGIYDKNSRKKVRDFREKMADFLIIFFKKIVYMNLNLLVATGLAYMIARGIKNPKIKYIIWSMVIVHFIYDLIFYNPSLLLLSKIPEHGSIAVGMAFPSKNMKAIHASLFDNYDREISCGDGAVYMLGTEKTVYISFFIVSLGIYLIINNLIRYVLFRKKLLETFSEEITIEKSQVKFSDYINTPFVFGLIKPVIVLPLSLKCHCNEEELHAVINHEIAHIERKDHIIFTLLNMLKSLFIFIFPLGIAIKKLEETEEYICDSMAVHKVKERKAIENAMLKLVKLQHQVQKIAYACPAFARNKNIIEGRLKNIYSTEYKRSFWSSLNSVIIYILSFILLFGCSIF